MVYNISDSTLLTHMYDISCVVYNISDYRFYTHMSVCINCLYTYQAYCTQYSIYIVHTYVSTIYIIYWHMCVQYT